jgi:hypothetical protein
MRLFAFLFLGLLVTGVVFFGIYLTGALARARLRSNKQAKAIELAKTTLIQIESKSEDAFASNLANVARFEINTILDHPQELA